MREHLRRGFGVALNIAGDFFRNNTGRPDLADKHVHAVSLRRRLGYFTADDKIYTFEFQGVGSRGILEQAGCAQRYFGGDVGEVFTLKHPDSGAAAQLGFAGSGETLDDRWNMKLIEVDLE